MYTTTILRLLIILTVIGNTACSKGTVIEPPKVADAALPFTQSVIEQAMADMQTQLTMPEFHSLNWANAKVVQQETKETVVTVPSLRTNCDTLLFLVKGEIKVYQWKGQVQPVIKK